MGETQLHIALREENLTIVRALLDDGAKTNIVSEFGVSARDLANEKGIDVSRLA